MCLPKTLGEQHARESVLASSCEMGTSCLPNRIVMMEYRGIIQ